MKHFPTGNTASGVYFLNHLSFFCGSELKNLQILLIYFQFINLLNVHLLIFLDGIVRIGNFIGIHMIIDGFPSCDLVFFNQICGWVLIPVGLLEFPICCTLIV